MKLPNITTPPLALLISTCVPTVAWLPLSANATPRFETVQGFELGLEQPRCKNLIRDAQGNLFGTIPSGGPGGGGAVFKMAPDGTLTTFHSFDYRVASNPDFGMTLGSDGNFYGTLIQGGPQDNGGIYKLTPSGEFTMLHLFTGGPDGKRPMTRLLLASDGNFYGATREGGNNGVGTFYRITPAGVFTTLTHWAENTTGWGVGGDIIEGTDGNFYGTHYQDSVSPSHRAGGVYRVTPAGVASEVVSFASIPTMNECFPDGLMQASDGNFYGTTSQGGTSNSGTIYKITPSGTFSFLAQFSGAVRSPNGPLVEGADGALYGTTREGGSYGQGTVFKVTKSGILTVLDEFEYEGPDPSHPLCSLTPTPDGNYVGTSTGGGDYDRGTVFQVTPSGETTVLASFKGEPNWFPNNKLLQASDGSWYGTTEQGGQTYNAIFKMTPDLTLSTLHEITTSAAYSPYKGALVEGADGNIYGATPYGGDEFGQGTIFRVTPEGAYEDFFTFGDTDGRVPNSLIIGPDGNFYGTTNEGGSDYCGNVFKLTPNAEFTQLLEFQWGSHGMPVPSITFGSDGNLYGITERGGTDDLGTAFKLTLEGQLSTLASIENQEIDGDTPVGGVIQASDGNFYGLLSYGGPDQAGTIYKLTPDGTKTTLFAFNRLNGEQPAGELEEGPDGALYGTTTYGGTNWEYGTVFRITKEGEFSTVFEFDHDHGLQPIAGLTRGQDNHLYGTTSWGGVTAEGKPAGGGQIFRLRFGAEVETAAATTVTSGSADLNASIQPSGYDTEVTFQYGTSPTLDSFSTLPAGTIPAGEEAVATTGVLAGLAPSTTYYFRAVATNAENPAPQVGEILSFTTSDVADIAVEAGNSTLPDGGFALAGVTRVGQSVDLTFTVRNTAPGTTLGGITASLSGVYAGSFAIVTPPAATLTGEATTTCVVRFAPGSAGIKVAKLSIASSDPDESPFDINLGGIALPAQGR